MSLGGEGGDDRPRDIQAEQSVLGACLLDPDAIATAMRVLSEEDFYRAAHRTLYAVLVAQWELGNPIDPVAVSAALEQSGELLRVGGLPYLHDLISAVPTSANVGHYADIVADRAARARIVDVGLRIRQLGAESPRDVGEVQEQVRDLVEKATVNTASMDADEGAWVGDLIDEHLASWDREEDPGIPSPWLDLNDVIGGGLQPGQVIVIAGRPGSGKSTAAKDWAVHAAERDFSVMFVSLEMSRGELIDRAVSSASKVRLSSIRARSMDRDESYRARRSLDNLRDLPLRIEDRFVSTIAGVRSKARDLARSERGLDLLVVDHINLLESTDAKKARNEEVSGFARALKLLAKELKIAVIEVSQLNRGPEQRPDKMPVLSDLKESGGLEENTDMAILLYRPDYYDRESPRSGEADLILAKHRNGPIATITVAHQLHYARFTDIARG